MYAEPAARLRLASLCRWNDDPVLGGEDQEMVMDRARLTDRYGAYPAETGWEPTWDLYGAAALGWELKAAAAANRTDISLGHVSMTRASTYTHCMEMAARMRLKVTQSVRLTPVRVHPGGDLRWP